MKIGLQVLASVSVMNPNPQPQNLSAKHTPEDCLVCESEVVDGQAPDVAVDSATATQRLLHLNEIGLALSSERNIERLLNLILTKARELTGADAGSLYLVEDIGLDEDEDGVIDRTLFFHLSQNDSVAMNTSAHFPASKSSLAGYSALTGEAIRCADAYQLAENAPYKFNPSWDNENGYRTCSVLVVPMKNHGGQVIGVLQLINRKKGALKLRTPEDFARHVLPFDSELAELAAGLASQAAVALENNRLLSRVTQLLEDAETALDSFVAAAASLIDDRDPPTAGHSERVTTLTVAMARVASEKTSGPFAEVQFSERELQELRYAGLLHDIGKIGVPDNIFSKSHKIEPLHFAAVLNRLDLRRRELETLDISCQLEAALGSGDAASQQSLREDLRAQLEQMKADRALLMRANDPSVSWLPDEEFAQQQAALQRLTQLHCTTEDGEKQPLLSAEEIASLGVRKGSLTEAERRQMENHAPMSFHFLSKIAWPSHFARIPDIAHCHHEKLNGRGYPRGVTAENIPLTARMMTVADIFDALTAADRPYKKAMPLERALRILREEAERGDLDCDVVALFIDDAIYQVLGK